MFDRFYSCLTGGYEYLASQYTTTGWEYIRRLGRSPAFGSIVFFPLVASFLTLSGKAKILFLPFPLDVSWRVHLFYWALFLLFVGSSFYAWRCPGMFNRYDNHLEYAKSELEILKHSTFARDTTKFIERRLNRHKGEVEHLHPAAVRQLEDAIKKVQAAIEDKSDGCVPESVLAPLLLAHWQFMNRADPRSRVAIYALYAMGLTLIAIVSVLSVGDVLLSYVR
jgi:hypothetical protein